MFTGIIECLGRVDDVVKEKSNLIFTVSSAISHELKVDQSVAHDGVCLTITAITGNTHTVTAIAETLNKTNLQSWKCGSVLNIERALMYGGRLDGHFVQGHVDAYVSCIDIKDESGSWRFSFSYDKAHQALLIPKGSVCINGVSLTIANLNDTEFSVAIIPYTYQHTSFQYIKIGDLVNVEFDVLGKYINRYMSTSQLS